MSYMKILYIDTASSNLYVAIIVDGEIISHREASKLNHSVMLMPTVDRILKENGYKLDDFDYYSCNVGPGSFTGIRIGVTTVNAFGYANSKKVIPITTFLPYAYDNRDKHIFALNAKHGNFYTMSIIDNVYEYGVKTESDLSDKDVFVIDPSTVPEKGLFECLVSSIGEATDMIAPFYLRESEAERNC